MNQEWRLPADGGVDLQPPDEAFPPFLQRDVMWKLRYAWIPSGGQFRNEASQTEQHILQKCSQTRREETERVCDLWPCCCLLFLFYPHGLQLDWTRDEGDVCSLLHEPADPPVIVVFLRESQKLLFSAQLSWSNYYWPTLCRRPLTSFMCRKSLVSKLIAAPWTGQSSSRAPQ